MATQVPPKKNTAFVFYVSLVDQGSRPSFKANPTLAAGDVKVAIDDGAPSNLTTTPTVDGDFTKRVKVSLTAAEMNGDIISIIFSDAAGAEWDDLFVEIHTASQQIDDIPTATENADALLARSVSNVEGSAGDHTLAAIILAILDASVSGSTWTIKKTDGTTTFLTKTITTDGSASPIVGVS